MEGSDGIVYAKVVACTDYSGYDCEGCIFSNCYGDICLLWGSDSCVDGGLVLWVRTGCHRGEVGGALG